jgi:hypothetical protein
MGVFIGELSRCFGQKRRSGGPTCLAGRPSRVAGVAKFHGRTDFPTSDPLLTDLT